MFKLGNFIANKISDNPGISLFLNKYLNRKLSFALIGYLEMQFPEIIQKSNREEIESFQNEKLKKIINYSKNNSPFYQNLLKDVEIENINDLSKIPILNREDISKNLELFLPKNANENSYYKIRTSGSTSTPISFYVGKDLLFRRIFEIHCAVKFFGKNPRIKILRLSFNSLPWVFYQGDYFDIFSGRDNDLYDLIKKYKYEALRGTASHLLSFAEMVRNNPLNHQFKFLISSAEYLSPENRNYLEKIFGCEVFIIYTTREFGALAQECRLRNGFHLNEEKFLFEIVDEKGNPQKEGIPGKILVTSFDNKIMPFIRYEIGDLGKFIPGYCQCGIKTRKIEFEGRACDFIILPENKKFPVIRLLPSVIIPGMIKSYQFIQKTKDALIIKIVPDINYNKETSNRIKDGIMKKINCGGNFTVSVEPTDRIELLSNGKSKILISEIKI